MNVLFVMHYPGYLRYYDGTVRLLAERGHTVRLAFDSLRKQSEGAEALSGMPEGVVCVGEVPKRTDLWFRVARRVRGTLDYVRYLDPEFTDTPYLRGRLENNLPTVFRFLRAIETLPRRWIRLLVRGLRALEAAIPSSRRIEAFIAAQRPDVVLMSPLVTDAPLQVDMIKSARRLGVPTGLCVASWDHLTTKGLIQIEPDIVVVWNETQKTEAVELHGIPPARLVVTGAQPFDRWFGREPSASREEFCRKVGLAPDTPFVLFVGSTQSISAPDAEVRFVQRWIHAIRESEDRAVRAVGVLVRPHPYNSIHWRGITFGVEENAAIWPRHGANPVNERDRADYFDSLYHSAAIVGINTSAMIEAAIVGRPVHTILTPEFRDTQGGTLHFRYLLPRNGGFVQTAGSLEEHLRQLSESVARAGDVRPEIARFVASFLRPHGVDRPCTPIVVEAVERLGAMGPRRPDAMPAWLAPVRLLLLLCGVGMRGASQLRAGCRVAFRMGTRLAMRVRAVR